MNWWGLMRGGGGCLMVEFGVRKKVTFSSLWVWCAGLGEFFLGK